MSEHSPILSIVGTTSVGKTDAALAVAASLSSHKEINGVVIISADSRQVYQGLEIVSGADIPNEFQKTFNPALFPFSYYQNDKTELHGISMLQPDQDWSVSQFQNFALQLIKASLLQHKVILIVGGTGLYHEHLFNLNQSLHIPPDLELRKKAANLSVEELQQWLYRVNPERLRAMNQSDKNNPRRLVRAIELNVIAGNSQTSTTPASYNHVYLGLRAPVEYILQKIENRVQQRLDNGVVQEVERLLVEPLSSQISSAVGFNLIVKYLHQEMSLDQLKHQWIIDEKNYAKRQITWWNTHAHGEWFDVSKSGQFEAALDRAEQILTSD